MSTAGRMVVVKLHTGSVPVCTRGKGYGQQILTHVMERYKGQTSVFDMESPRQECDNSEQRKRRHAFYLRNGFRDTNVYKMFIPWK